jgi:hypothetical protein
MVTRQETKRIPKSCEVGQVASHKRGSELGKEKKALSTLVKEATVPFLKPPISEGSARRVSPARRYCCVAGASQKRGRRADGL